MKKKLVIVHERIIQVTKAFSYFLIVDHISGPVSLEQYVAIADYKKQNRNEVNMVAGDIVEVIDKNENGTTKQNRTFFKGVTV